MKLVSDLKQFLILNDFPSMNEAIDQRNQQLRVLQEECNRKPIMLRDEISIDLCELEKEYYSSRYK
ncbi:Mediator of RNA polymerase II transcription subunit 22 [Plecturocebus cupreus]